MIDSKTTPIEIEVNGQRVQARPGEMLIQTLDREGIYVPRFCYHEKLSVAANCRMCLVDVDKVAKPQPACATPVREGMVVRTQSEKTIEAQKSVMEFLLINHPLDCPICDQGGECELQDLAMGYGSDVSRYSEKKRTVADENLGSLIATDMTRCIHCTRCIRFSAELAGAPELGATERGEHMRIGTYINKKLVSELSGNVIDVCPVGALTSKPYRYKARAWELQQKPSISPHDCLGTNLNIHVRRQEVMRVIPRANEAINEVWIADRDRFSYLSLRSADRLTVPLLKRAAQWQEAEWEEALAFVAKELSAIIEADGADEIAVLASPSSTLEELYLLQKLFRALGCQNLDHRLHATDVADQATESLYPGLNQPIADLETQQAVLLIGSHVRHEQPLASLRLRKAYRNGAVMMAINPVDFAFTFELAEKIIVAPSAMIDNLVQVASALPETKEVHLPEPLQQWIRSSQPSEVAQRIARQLQRAEKSSVLLGALASNHPQASIIRQIARYIAVASGSVYGRFTEGANTAGAWIAGMLPHRTAAGKAVVAPGLSAYAAFENPRKAYVLFNVEPDLDCANPQLVRRALTQAKRVISLSTFASPGLRDLADVILPVAPFTETAGTFVNASGHWQSFQPAVLPWERAKPGWKVLRVLGNLLEVPGFDYQQIEQIKVELEQCLVENEVEPQALVSIALPQDSARLQRITEWPLYRTDGLVRRAEALQDSAAQLPLAVRINSKLAQELALLHGQPVKVKQDQGQVALPWVIDERIPDHCVYVPTGYAETAVLGDNFGAIEIHA